VFSVSDKILHFPPLRPSRDFAVRQAVLLALYDLYPMLIAGKGLVETARFVANTFPGNGYFRRIVRDHFDAIAARYDLKGL
jgi:hypothetical protein